MKPTELPDQIFNKENSGKINLYSYEYPGSKTVLDSNLFQRKLDDLISMWQMCISILKENKKDKTGEIIYYSLSDSRATFIFFITKIKKILLLHCN